MYSSSVRFDRAAANASDDELDEEDELGKKLESDSVSSAFCRAFKYRRYSVACRSTAPDGEEKNRWFSAALIWRRKTASDRTVTML